MSDTSDLYENTATVLYMDNLYEETPYVFYGCYKWCSTKQYASQCETALSFWLGAECY